jgi:hypothetical protein
MLDSNQNYSTIISSILCEKPQNGERYGEHHKKTTKKTMNKHKETGTLHNFQHKRQETDIFHCALITMLIHHEV